jgi:DNA-binding transcriptional LysR family regulator
VLSRQLRAFEDELGLPLFRRDRRGTTLTRAGQQLLDDARPLLVSAQALRRVAVAARGPMFTIGFMPGITVTSAVRTMQARHPSSQADGGSLTRDVTQHTLRVSRQHRRLLGFEGPSDDFCNARLRPNPRPKQL